MQQSSPRAASPRSSAVVTSVVKLLELATFAAAFTIPALAPATARADDDTIRTPGDHPAYRFELEPHLTLGWDNVYSASGLGVGGRMSIPIVQNGFIPSINNSVAITFGLELLHYGGCHHSSSAACGANYLFFPVAMQWNFFVARQWSVFGEPGLALFNGFFSECDGAKNCQDAEKFGWRPVFYAGARYHLSESLALTMRLGYPAFTFGVSFM